MSTNREQTEQIASALFAPFEPGEVRWKPQAISGNRALAIAYIDARLVMDRLDDVVGVDGWQDEYQQLADGSVVCQLRVRFGGEWVTKTDVGGQSEQPDEGDRHKAAFSDALKRAAIKFGIGRYLYRLPSQWVDWDPQKKKFLKTPALPANALPKPKPKPSQLPKSMLEPPPNNNGGENVASAKVSSTDAHRIKALCDKLGWHYKHRANHLKKRHEVEFIRDLTAAQAGQMIAHLEKLLADRQPGDEPDGGDGDPQDDLITDAQLQELKGLLTRHGVPEADLLTAYQVARLEDLPAVHFEDAKARVEKAGRKGQKAR